MDGAGGAAALWVGDASSWDTTGDVYAFAVELHVCDAGAGVGFSDPPAPGGGVAGCQDTDVGVGESVMEPERGTRNGRGAPFDVVPERGTTDRQTTIGWVMLFPSSALCTSHHHPAITHSVDHHEMEF